MRYYILGVFLSFAYVIISQSNEVELEEAGNFRLIQLTQYPRKYEKIEFGLLISDSLRQQINDFLHSKGSKKKGLNPFNRNDIDLELAVYRNDSLLRKSYGFYYEDMEVDTVGNRWTVSTNELPFLFRFICDKEGEYELKLKVLTKDQLIFTDSTWILVHSSEHKGFLEKGEYHKNFRYVETKKSFVGVGQNLPWLQWVKWNQMHMRAGPIQFEQYMQSLEQFGRAEGNFTRLVFAPWSFQLEFEALGNYQNAMGQAFALDKVLEYMEQQEIYTMICALLHTPLSDPRHVDPSNTVSWNYYCYNSKAKKHGTFAHEEIFDVHDPIDFYKSESAKNHQKNYFRYIVSRWGYSSAIAAWQLVSEQDETASYRDESLKDEIVDHSESREIIAEWNHEMLDYIKTELYDFHLLGTSLIGGFGETKDLWQPGLYDDTLVDFQGFHNYYYNFPGMQHSRNGNLLIRYESISTLNTGYQFGKQTAKGLMDNLFIFDESGYILTEQAEYRPGILNDPTQLYNKCSGLFFKQDLWFYLCSGAAVAGLDWWNEHDPSRHEAWVTYFPPMQKFVENIDFEKVNYTKVHKGKDGYPIIAQRWPETNYEIKRSNGEVYKRDEILEAYTLISENGDQGFGWMNNRSVNLFNLIDTLECFRALYHGHYPFGKQVLFEAKDADAVGHPIKIVDEEYSIKVRHLSPFKRMKIVYYSTTTGAILDEKHNRVSPFGILKIACPELIYGKNSDVSFKFWNSKESWK